MKAWEYNAVVLSDGGPIFCVDCLDEWCGDDYELRDELIYHPIFADSEWDRYPVCDHCGKEHDYVGLTSDGEQWLWERAAQTM